MQIINTQSIEQVKKAIKQAKSKPIIVQAQNDEFNRKILEYGKFDILLSPESGNRKNTITQIDSGLNHILAKIAAKNNIAIGIDLDNLVLLSKQEKAETLSRLIQNIKICRKAKAKLVVLSKDKDKREISSFLLSLGASTQQAKEATQTF